jgi:hypothetical protein
MAALVILCVSVSISKALRKDLLWYRISARVSGIPLIHIDLYCRLALSSCLHTVISHAVVIHSLHEEYEMSYEDVVSIAWMLTSVKIQIVFWSNAVLGVCPKSCLVIFWFVSAIYEPYSTWSSSCIKLVLDIKYRPHYGLIIYLKHFLIWWIFTKMQERKDSDSAQCAFWLVYSNRFVMQ